MKKGGVGGANTKTGLDYEEKVCFRKLLLSSHGYEIKQNEQAGESVFYNDKLVARLFLENKTLFIIEIKFQNGTGSTDEKLQTCDFKRKQYVKLVHQIGLKVEYVYVLNDWFKQLKYKDVLDYIHQVGCHYKFNELPLAWLGLPE